MDYLKDSYWARRPKDNYELNVAACRLIMSLIPGLETTVVFESVSQIYILLNILIFIKIIFFSLQTMILSTGYSLGLKQIVNLYKRMLQDYWRRVWNYQI